MNIEGLNLESIYNIEYMHMLGYEFVVEDGKITEWGRNYED